MLKLLLLVFVVIPIIELTLIFKLGNWLGWIPTLALVFGAGIIGAAIARVQGVRAALQVRQQLAGGAMPAVAVINGVLIALAGVLLIIPGVVSDVLGLALLFPWTRAIVRRWLMNSFRARVQVIDARGWRAAGDAQRVGRDQIIDARVIDSRIVDE